MDQEKRSRLIEEKLTEESIRQEFGATVPDRVHRYLAVKPHEISPNQHFAAVSDECARLYRDGHFYGCIALTQAVAEAISRFLCQRNGWKPAKQYEENVGKLRTRGFISVSAANALLKMWEDRDDYHHLNPSVETDRAKLGCLAKEKALRLAEVEREVFHFEIKDGKLVPKNPKYWDMVGDKAEVFLSPNPPMDRDGRREGSGRG